MQSFQFWARYFHRKRNEKNEKKRDGSHKKNIDREEKTCQIHNAITKSSNEEHKTS